MTTLPRHEYTDDELLDIMSGHEISQEDNLNAHARLFVRDDGDSTWVYKLFDRSDPRSHERMDNLARLSHDDGFGRSDYVAWPDELVVRSGIEVGYRMPYAEGPTLGELLLRTGNGSIDAVNGAFVALDEALLELHPIVVGDLHGGNVVVRDGFRITVVDPDSLSRDGWVCSSSPLSYAPRTPSQLFSGDLGPDGAPRTMATHAQDFGCMLRLYLACLLGGVDALHMDARVLSAYLRHLRGLESCARLADAAGRWLSTCETTGWVEIATVSEADSQMATLTAFSRTDGYRSLPGVSCLNM